MRNATPLSLLLCTNGHVDVNDFLTGLTKFRVDNCGDSLKNHLDGESFSSRIYDYRKNMKFSQINVRDYRHSTWILYIQYWTSTCKKSLMELELRNLALEKGSNRFVRYTHMNLKKCHTSSCIYKSTTRKQVSLPIHIFCCVNRRSGRSKLCESRIT